MLNKCSLKFLVPTLTVFLFSVTSILGQPQTPPIHVDSLTWDLQGQVNITEHHGRKCFAMNGGEAILKNFELRDGVIDVDAEATEGRGFFGIEFRANNDSGKSEFVYLRPHKSGLPDAIQYTPILGGGFNWQIYNGTGFTGAVDIPKDEWFHIRLEVSGAQAKLYVTDMEKPVLVMDDLKSGVQKGQIGFAVLLGKTYFSNFKIRSTPDAAWERHLPSMEQNIITNWSISPSYDALAHNLESSLKPSEEDTINWRDVKAEPPGFVVLYRYYEAPHLRVSFANDFSKRLEPQPGMKVVYAKTIIHSDKEETKKLYIGYSDDVSVFLNGKILFRGRSAQYFRDPGFLGIVNPENDAVYLPLKQGNNELMLAVSELGGGWGFICRLADFGK